MAVDQPPKHQPNEAGPAPSASVFEYSELTRPGTSERQLLEAQVARLGWSNLFELTPPGVSDAYQVISDDLNELAQQLGDFADESVKLRSLATYIRTLHRLDQQRDEFGLWWGFPADSRSHLTRLARQLRAEGPLSADQIERLLERWNDTEDESVTQFLDLVEADEVALLGRDGSILISEASGSQSIRRWLELSACDEYGPDRALDLAATSQAFAIVLRNLENLGSGSEPNG